MTDAAETDDGGAVDDGGGTPPNRRWRNLIRLGGADPVDCPFPGEFTFNYTKSEDALVQGGPSGMRYNFVEFYFNVPVLSCFCVGSCKSGEIGIGGMWATRLKIGIARIVYLDKTGYHTIRKSGFTPVFYRLKPDFLVLKTSFRIIHGFLTI